MLAGSEVQRRGGAVAIPLDDHGIEVIAPLGFEEIGQIAQLPAFGAVEDEQFVRLERQAPASRPVAPPQVIEPVDRPSRVRHAARPPHGTIALLGERRREAALHRQVEKCELGDPQLAVMVEERPQQPRASVLGADNDDPSPARMGRPRSALQAEAAPLRAAERPEAEAHGVARFAQSRPRLVEAKRQAPSAEAGAARDRFRSDGSGDHWGIDLDE